jgi:hypothetical protein
MKPLMTSVSPSGHRISTSQPDPGFFRAPKVGRCSDILRICAHGATVQASYPATVKPTRDQNLKGRSPPGLRDSPMRVSAAGPPCAGRIGGSAGLAMQAAPTGGVCRMGGGHAGRCWKTRPAGPMGLARGRSTTFVKGFQCCPRRVDLYRTARVEVLRTGDNPEFGYEHYSSGPSKKVRTAMGRQICPTGSFGRAQKDRPERHGPLETAANDNQLAWPFIPFPEGWYCA